MRLLWMSSCYSSPRSVSSFLSVGFGTFEAGLDGWLQRFLVCRCGLKQRSQPAAVSTPLSNLRFKISFDELSLQPGFCTAILWWAQFAAGVLYRYSLMSSVCSRGSVPLFFDELSLQPGFCTAILWWAQFAAGVLYRYSLQLHFIAALTCIARWTVCLLLSMSSCYCVSSMPIPTAPKVIIFSS